MEGYINKFFLSKEGIELDKNTEHNLYSVVLEFEHPLFWNVFRKVLRACKEKLKVKFNIDGKKLLDLSCEEGIFDLKEFNGVFDLCSSHEQFLIGSVKRLTFGQGECVCFFRNSKKRYLSEPENDRYDWAYFLVNLSSILKAG